MWASPHLFTYVCARSCPTLCDPWDCSPPGSSIHRISQARTLEWVTISFSRVASPPRVWTMSLVPPSLQANSLLLSHRGSPYLCRCTSNHISFSTLTKKNLTPSYFPPIFPFTVGCCSSCLEGSGKKVVQKRTTLSAENKMGWELEHCSSSAAAQGFFGGWNWGSPSSGRKGSEST